VSLVTAADALPSAVDVVHPSAVVLATALAALAMLSQR